jgi:hypothetical protein
MIVASPVSSLYSLSFSQELLELSSYIANMNPNHDEKGRFSSGEGSGSGTSGTTDTGTSSDFKGMSGFGTSLGRHPNQPSAVSRVSSATKKAVKATAEAVRGVSKATYDALPKPVQRVVDGGAYVEHKLVGFYKDHQALAKEVARERGGDQHAERVGRALAVADYVAKASVNIPALHAVLHHGLEATMRYSVGDSTTDAVEHWDHHLGEKLRDATGADSLKQLGTVGKLALAVVGGPVSTATFVGAKVAWYVPTASLAYVGYQAAKEGLSGRNPVELIRKARERVRANKEAKGTESHGH